MTEERAIRPEAGKTGSVPGPEGLRVYQGIRFTDNRLDALLLVAAPDPKAAKETSLEVLADSPFAPDDLEWTEIDVDAPRILYAEIRKGEGESG